MTPYYEHAGITIYHGDCREVLPQLAPADLVLTDPPYGIGLDTKYSRIGDLGVVRGMDYDPVTADDGSLDLGFLFSYGTTQVVFGANNWPTRIPFSPKRDGWLCWDKRENEGADKILGSPFELAVVIGRRLYKIIRMQHCGVKNADGDNAGRFHPTQKPVKLMRVIGSWFEGASILDPFMGSGTTLRAAKDLGRKGVGIEIEEKYCEIAAKRLSQEVMEFK